jgi:hypothetical protein
MAPASFGTTVIYEQKTLLSVDEKARGQHCKKDDRMYHHNWTNSEFRIFHLTLFSPFIFIWPLPQHKYNPASVQVLLPITQHRSIQFRNEIRKFDQVAIPPTSNISELPLSHDSTL